MFRIDIKRLQAKIIENGMTQDGLSSELGIDRGTLRRRLNSGRLQVRDVHKICDVLHLSNADAISIFLSEQSHECD